MFDHHGSSFAYYRLMSDMMLNGTIPESLYGLSNLQYL